ncbi:Leukocyte immunoglobulin-like receptor subfamily A member 6 [Lemmus lemmus]
MDSEIPLEPRNKVEFSISKVESHHAGLYRCYYHIKVGRSEDSETQELVVTGVYSKPRLSVQPSPVATPGENVTLQCVSKQKYDRFILTKEGPEKLSWMLDSQYNHLTRQFQALFSVGPVTISQRWTFRCYSYNRSEPQVWSEPSEPLDLLFSGIHYYKPSLSVLPSPMVTSRRNMTLQCASRVRYDKFILTKENEKFTSSLNTQYIYPTGNYQVLFSMENMTPAHAGTFRCYGYYKNTSHLWSVPSEPLEIHISGESTLSLTNCFLRQ